MNQFFTKRSRFVNASASLGALGLILLSLVSFGQTTYTWKAGGNGSWSDGSNWSPARTTLGATDVLVFDGTFTPSTSVTLDFATSQTIGQLVFTNRVQVTLNTNANRTLVIGAQPPAVGLQMDAGTLVQIFGTLGSSSSLAVQLAVGTRAAIAGRLEFTSSINTNSTHTLSSGTAIIVGTANAIEFLSGSYFKAGPKFSGSPFGSLKNNGGTVVLRSGATCEQASGTTPFGGNTYDALVCQAGSTFLYTASGSGNDVSLSGHTFGYLVLNTTSSSVSTTYSNNTTPTVILNDLTVQGGAHTIDVAQLELWGSIFLNGGSLGFNPTITNSLVLKLNGTSSQAIGGTASGALTLPSNVTLVLNDAAGLTLQRPLQANGFLTLSNGLLTTTAANSLTLGPTATISGGSAASFVNGPLSWSQTGTTVNLFFPIGSGQAYRPLTLTGQQADAPTTYTAQQFNQAPTARTFPTAAGSLQRVSRIRYFTVTNNGAANFTQGRITINYGIDDKVDAPDKLRLAKSDNAGNWLDLGGAGTGAPVGGITSTVPFASFSDFVLASTEADGGAGNNPLPVSLTGFSARRETGGVRLDWTTASEYNNSRFEVQRSADGLAFATLKTVPGSGTSTGAHAYNWLDAADLASGPLYYRLRQIDADGTGTYSPVATVLPDAAHPGVFPNPAQQRISFGAPAGSAYRVLNALGQLVLAGRTPAEGTALSLPNLGPGIYYLEISSAQGRARYRLVKE